MSLERRLAAISAFAIALTLLASGFLLLSDSRANMDRAETNEIEATAQVLSAAMAQAESMVQTQAELVAHDPEVARLMAAADRPALQARMKPVLDILRQEAGMDVLHFHSRDMISFLRVWQPEDFGQDLALFRPMILAANKSQKPQKGLEIGLKGLSLRSVSPILDQGQLVGTVETGLDLKTLLDQAKATTGAEFAIYIAPEAFPDGKGGFAVAGGPLRLDASTNRALFNQLNLEGLISLSRAAKSQVHAFNGAMLGMLGQPLLDFSGKMIGTLIVVKDVSALEASFKATLITVAAVALSGLVLCYGIFMVGIRAFVIRPLEQLARECRAGSISDATSRLVAYLGLHEVALKRHSDASDKEEDSR
ncbi:cache domain-containing protein [Rhizobium alvei]|uniref:Cache domain-containing protein n=1 Tax=Rhizobium alvei TaxID=1132659 RepID=A0ABT8YH81_9HYPH|nr:cache domain-containing protein [Rhizobium alvei]MDO6962678.1 cache domain-containing protein [Rhizobium alvei]